MGASAKVKYHYSYSHLTYPVNDTTNEIFIFEVFTLGRRGISLDGEFGWGGTSVK